MHKSRFAFIALADVGIIATFLPWEKISVLGVASTKTGIDITESILGTSGVGWVSLVLFALVPLISFTGKRAAPILAAKKWGIVIVGLLTAIIGIHTYLDVRQKAVINPLESGGLSFESAPGIGLYMVIVAAIGLIVMALVSKGRDVQNPS